MTTGPETRDGGSTPRRDRAVVTEQTYTWPPSATAVFVFVVVVFMVGGPATWWAVSR